MILEEMNSVIAYRCPCCGQGVISNVGVFALTAEKIALRCPCKRSELELIYTKDGKIRISVPCLFCPSPHVYTVSKAAFFKKELFTLECPYTGSGTVFIGELNHVKAELSRTELELLDVMNEHGVETFDPLRKKEPFTDKEIFDVIMYVIGELDEEGKIYCKCPKRDSENEEKDYDVAMTDDGILVSCPRCGASKLIPTDSHLAAHAFLYSDSLTLE